MDELPIKDILLGVTRKGLLEISRELHLKGFSALDHDGLVESILSGVGTKYPPDMVLSAMQARAVLSTWKPEPKPVPTDVMEHPCKGSGPSPPPPNMATFQARPVQIGDGIAIMIPGTLLGAGWLDIKKEYKVTLEDDEHVKAWWKAFNDSLDQGP